MSEAVAARPAAAVRARHAASLIVLGPGPAMLMGMRGAGHRFMPNKTRLSRGRGGPSGHPGAGGVRTLPACRGADRQVDQPPAWSGRSPWRRRASWRKRPGCRSAPPPALAGLDYLGRAVTPPGGPIRFNARFFVVPAEAVGGTLAGSGELEDLQWWRVEAALALDLARPTRAVIGLLQAWLALTPAARAARTVAPVMRNRKWGME